MVNLIGEAEEIASSCFSAKFVTLKYADEGMKTLRQVLGLLQEHAASVGGRITNIKV